MHWTRPPSMHGPSPHPWFKTYKHYEICKYIADIGVGTTGSPVYAMSINLKKWNSLSGDIQKQILEVTEDWWKNFEKRVTGSPGQ